MFNSILKTTIFGILLVGAYTFAVSEGYIDISKNDEELLSSIKDIETKIESLEKLSGKSDLSSEISDLKNEVQDASLFLKAEISISKILSNFSEISKESGLQLLLFEPQTVVNEGVYFELPIKIKLRGTFRQTGNFLFQISKLTYSVVISDLTINGIISNSGYVINETEAIISIYNHVGDIWLF